MFFDFSPKTKKCFFVFVLIWFFDLCFWQTDLGKWKYRPRAPFCSINAPRSLQKNYFRYRDVRIPDFPIFDKFLRIFIKASRRSCFFCQNRATGLYFNVLFRFCPGIAYRFIFFLGESRFSKKKSFRAQASLKALLGPLKGQ